MKYAMSFILLAMSIVVYTIAATVGWHTAAFEPTSWPGIVAASAASIIYKIGHLPLSLAAGIVTFRWMCGIVGCGRSMTERERDITFFITCAVVFTGLCNAR